MNKRILCIPDAHVTPDDKDMWRFNALGKLIVERRPDLIVQLGDFVSLESLSHWDQNKRLLMEHRRYKKDIAAGKDAIKRIFDPLFTLQKKQKDWKMKVYRPKTLWFEGNHEAWATQYIEQHPEMCGSVNVASDLGLTEMGMSALPYRSVITTNGISFCHAPMMANNKATGGKYALNRASELHNNSIVFAHLHRYESLNVQRNDTKNISMSLCCGCFFVDTPLYAQGSHGAYWKGVTLLHQYDYGLFDTEQISIERMKHGYGYQE